MNGESVQLQDEVGERLKPMRWFIAPFAVAIALSFGISIGSTWAKEPPPTPFLGPVPKPTCGPSDRTETGLDGQLTLAERMSGASTQPYNCNLEVVGQYVGEGADHQLAWQDDCAYYTTNDVMPLMSPGVQVIDVSDPTNPRQTANLGDPSLLQPWESLQVNHKRKLLAGVEAEGGSGQQPGFSIYDVSNCRHPRLKASVTLPNTAIKGHAGNFTPDGKTFYGTDIGVSLYAIDITNPSNPGLITNWTFPNGQAGLPHYITPDFDGVLGYIGQNGSVSTPGHVSTNNGLTIVDLSQIQFRIPNPQVSVVSTLYWFDSEVSEVSVPVKINGTPFIVFTDENGSGGTGRAPAACAADLPPWGFVRLIDVSDPENPIIAAKLILEVEDPANCDSTENDVPSNDSYGYSSHDCGVDNPYDAKLIACSYHEAGVRVFDIHDPYHPQEIAYYKGAARGVNGPLLPGSSLAGMGANTYSWAKARSRFVWKGDQLYLWLTSSESGLVVAKFENMASINALHPVPEPGNEEPNN